MKYLCTFIFLLLLFSTASFAQRTASASSTTAFKNTSSGTVESQYSFAQALSPEEAEEIIRWAEANAPHIEIILNQNKTAFTLRVSNEYNTQSVYLKTFLQAGISEITYTENGLTKTYPVSEFLEAMNVNP
ncbi:MAG TPA: hypothetical protein VIK71_03625 [Flavobacteriales bacterium]